MKIDTKLHPTHLSIPLETAINTGNEKTSKNLPEIEIIEDARILLEECNKKLKKLKILLHLCNQMG